MKKCLPLTNRPKNILFLFLFIFSLNSSFGQKEQSDFKIVGYYSLQSAMSDDKEFPFKSLTHVNLYFLNPDTVGNYTQDLSGLKPFVKEAHKNGVKVLFSIGGGGAHPYYHKLLKDDMRGTIVKKLIDLVVAYDIDGIDNDLEHGDIGEHYEAFNVELGAALKTHHKLLTAAVVANPSLFSDKTLEQFDFINMMSYDHTGPWAPDIPGPHASFQQFVEDLDHYAVKRGIAAKKIVMGIPFYGHVFGPGVTPRDSWINYCQIIENYPDAELFDELAIEGNRMLYYNGIATVKRKTQLAKERAGGIMIWELGGDCKGKKSLLSLIHKTAYSK